MIRSPSVGRLLRPNERKFDADFCLVFVCFCFSMKVERTEKKRQRKKRNSSARSGFFCCWLFLPSPTLLIGQWAAASIFFFPRQFLANRFFTKPLSNLISSNLISNFVGLSFCYQLTQNWVLLGYTGLYRVIILGYTGIILGYFGLYWVV